MTAARDNSNGATGANGLPPTISSADSNKLLTKLSLSMTIKAGQATDILSSDPHQRHILVIAHDPQQRDILWAGLQLSGYAAVLLPAADWRDATHLTTHLPVGLVIVQSDVATSARGGFEFRNTTGVPVIALDSRGSNLTLEAGASLPIPYNFQDLLLTVARYSPLPAQPLPSVNMD